MARCLARTRARPKMVAGEIGLTVLDLPPLFHPSPLTAETPATISPISSFIDDDQVSGGTFYSGRRWSTAGGGELFHRSRRADSGSRRYDVYKHTTTLGLLLRSVLRVWCSSLDPCL